MKEKKEIELDNFEIALIVFSAGILFLGIIIILE